MRTNSSRGTTRLRGILWIVAATPFLLSPLVFSGGMGATAPGIVFLIIGIVVLSRGEPQGDG